MRKRIILTTVGFFIGLLGLRAQTTCPDDRVAYVDSKNIDTIGAYTLSMGMVEKASQAYHYSGPGKVAGARVFGKVENTLGAAVKVSLYNVDANDRPTGAALATAPLQNVYPWSSSFFDVSFSPAVSVSSNFAMVVELVSAPGCCCGDGFKLSYTGNGEGLGEDLASLAGTSTGFNWASAMSDFDKDGDFYIYPRMINFNTPMFTIPSTCVNTGVSVSFTNATEMTTDRMFNRITQPGYSGSNFLYTWDFGDGSPVSHLANPTHSYSTPGDYTVVLTSVIDGWDSDCIKMFSKVISVGLSVVTTTVTNVSCNGFDNGSVTATSTGGTAPYMYSLDGIVYQSSPTFSDLSAGMYTLYTKDSNGCIQSTTFTITQPSPIIFTSTGSTNASCGGSNGGILVTTSGGVAPIQYQLNSGAFQSSGSFSGLAAGGYMVTARDANGCMFSTIVVVEDLGGPSFDDVNGVDVTCFEGNDGSISLTSLGGTGTIEYSIDGGTTFQTNGMFSNITQGTYVVVVRDNLNCTDIQVVTINEPEEIRVLATSINLACNASADGQIDIISVTGGTGAMSYSVDGVNYQSGTHFSGLAAGVYTVSAKDIGGCTGTVSVTVGQPTNLTATVTATNATCNGDQNGSITVAGSGGTAPYLYAIGEAEEFQEEGFFNNLAANSSYDVFVMDANGCMYTTTVAINQPTEIVVVATTTNSTCGNSNGGILVTATGGSGSGYTYSINGGSFGTGSFSGLAAGVYMITAKDGAGCTSVSKVNVFDADGPSNIMTTHTNVNCHGGTDGTINVISVTGGTGVLQYSINGIVYQTSNVFTGLPMGIYNVSVKDANGCVGNTTVTITEPNAFVINATVVNVLCNGSQTGSVTLLVGGGSGTLAYSINNGVTYQSSNTFSNLGAGNYNIIVKDAGGCLGYKTIVITQPTPITATYSTLNVYCSGQQSGSIIVQASGGVGALSYSLDGITYQISNEFMNLDGGFYTIYVKDANNCVKTIIAYVYEPAPLSVDGIVSDVSCHGGNNGMINLNVHGGTSVYSFEWSNGIENEDNINLVAGTYSVIVSDVNGCEVTMLFTIMEPEFPIIVNGTVTNPTGSNNGAIDVTVTGGVGGYSFLWTNGVVSDDLTNIGPGVYTIVVTDSNGCSNSSSFNVPNNIGIATLSADIDGVSLYPNPTNEYVVIEVDGFNIDKIELIDVIGQITFSSEFKESKVQINTSGLEQGMYFVKILSQGKLVTKSLQIIR